MGYCAAAFVATFFFSLSHHLGLVEKVAAVCGEIASCPMCTTFWGVLFVLALSGCPLFFAAPAALLSAYAANWLGLIYDGLARVYLKVWNINRTREQNP